MWYPVLCVCIHHGWWGALTSVGRYCLLHVYLEIAYESNLGKKLSPTSGARVEGGYSGCACHLFFMLVPLTLCLSWALLLGFWNSLVDEAAPGCVIQSCTFPGGVVNLKCSERNLGSVLESFVLATMWAFSCGYFTKEELLGEMFLWHLDNVACTSDLVFHQYAVNGGNVCCKEASISGPLSCSLTFGILHRLVR